MSIYNTTNVKDLPQLEEVINGNFLIVENQLGTNIIDFKNFVIGPDNASFYNTIVSLSGYAVSMSATTNSTFKSVSARITSLSATVDSKVQSATAALVDSYPRYFEVYPTTITVAAGNNGAAANFNSELASIAISDVNIVPTNNHAASAGYFASLGQVVNPGSPPSPSPYTYTIRISTTNTSDGNATFVTKVQKYF
jgi:hypothetical protein